MGYFRDYIDKARANFSFPFSAAFGWLATVIGIVGGGVALLDSFEANSTVREWVLATALAAITIVSILTLAWREWKLSLGVRYVSTLTHQRESARLLRDVLLYLTEHQNEHATKEVLQLSRRKFEQILTHYATIYSIITGTRCRMCLKLLKIGGQIASPSSDDIFVYAVARDSISAEENRTRDGKRAEKGHDKLKNNSDYLRLWDKDVKDLGYYIGKDLSRDPDYESSSLSYEKNPNKPTDEVWPLWYKSAIVWPVRRESSDELGLDTEVCLGFLSVDAKFPNVFTSDEHVTIGRILAYALFPILDLYIRAERVVTSAPRREPRS